MAQRTRWRPDEQTRRKYELAEQLGLTSLLREKGWAGISAKDTGRIGGSMRRRRR
ncbi:MAG: small, acid-soluble spore protein, alpha/beta type [bacterium]|nr:small, acid-soluble spore protein, alpha/beta type [bacterium]